MRPRGKPESVPVPNASEMRELLDTATGKKVREMLRRLGLQLPDPASLEVQGRRATGARSTGSVRPQRARPGAYRLAGRSLLAALRNGVRAVVPTGQHLAQLDVRPSRAGDEYAQRRVSRRPGRPLPRRPLQHSRSSRRPRPQTDPNVQLVRIWIWAASTASGTIVTGRLHLVRLGSVAPPAQGLEILVCRNTALGDRHDVVHFQQEMGLCRQRD